MENHGLPTGIDHLKLIGAGGTTTRQNTFKGIGTDTDELSVFGTSLCALYQAATCHRKCHRGSHILESLSGRSYNLACAAFTLLTLGYYDEALNLVRSMGEIGNLIMLSVVNKDAIKKWIESDRSTRLKDFSPMKVRKALEAKGDAPLIAEYDWYIDLCEKYTHPTPGTRPNMHTGQKSHAGGVFQKDGFDLAIGELSTITISIAMLICRYFEFDDLFAEIVGLVRGLDDAQSS
ncbi:MAG TPA: hypothetical protein VIJ85_04580 [Rhizomicrobium sp.]